MNFKPFLSRTATGSTAGALALTVFLAVLAGCAPGAGTPSVTQSPDTVRAEAAYTQAQKLTDPTQREAELAKAMRLYDQATLSDPALGNSPNFSNLLKDYSTLLSQRGGNAALPVETRRELLTSARFISERQPDAVTGARDLLSIARQQIRIGDYRAAVDTLTAGYVRMAKVPAAQRDPVVGDMARLLALAAGQRDRATAWATEITDPVRRGAVLSDVSRWKLRVGDFTAPELASFRDQSVAELDRRSPELLDAAETLRVNGNTEAALAAALAARVGTPDRDNLLLTLVQEATTNEQRDVVEIAAFGISSIAQQNEALFFLAMGNTDSPRLSIAERLTQSLTDTTLKAQVLSQVAAAYAKSHVTQAATAQTLETVKITSFFMPRAAKSRINANLALVDIYSGDYPRALMYANRIGEPDHKTKTLQELARRATSSRDWATAEKAINGIKSAGQREQAALLRAVLLAAKEQPDAIASLAKSQTSPGTKAWVLAYAADAYAKRIEPAKALAIVAQIEALRAKASSVEEVQQTASAAVFALASTGQPVKAEAYLLDAMADDNVHYLNALTELAAAWAKVKDTGRIDQAVAWALDEHQASDMLQRVVRVFSDKHEYEVAALYARQIPDYQDRVRSMRQLAAASAEALDIYGVLDGGVTRPDNTARERQVILKGQAATYYNIGNNKVGESIPTPPNLNSYSRQAVSDNIPVATDGGVYVIPMEYSYYNTKFVSQVNNTFRQIGEKVFPVQAQGTRYPRYIHIESGVLTLESLARHLNSIGEGELLIRKGSRYMLNVPLLVGPQASLVISGTDAEELRLNSNTGVFIVNAGKLWLHDITVAGWDAAGKAYPKLDFDSRNQFRPFLISWGGSQMHADGSHFHHLGFNGAKGYGFSYSQGPILVQQHRPGALNRPTGMVVDNSFEEMYFGFFTNAADDIALIGNEYRNNLIYGVDPHDYSKRLIIAYNVSYGTVKKHGIIGSREVDDSWIVGNIVFDNHGTGIMLDRISSGNLVYANRVWGNGQDGLAVYESPCNILAGNRTFENHGDAVKVRNSTDIGIFRNHLITAQRAGVNIYVGDPKEVIGFPTRDAVKDPYTKFVTVAVVDNVIDKHNGTGITATGFGTVAVKGNQFFGSTKKLLQGDLEPHGREMLRLQGEGVVVRSSCRAVNVPKVCPFLNQGYLSGVVEELPPANGAGMICTGTLDPDQETAEAGAEFDSEEDHAS
ncbi:carbohydrate-binding and sugar hydrolysis [Asticcacaulis biprosthecium C19]|uniref:Carbohydrate-binding and sugar hydrolysis n=1 Tax=Asticcacaulis biprosthecium C19 TaxID=715226 RepID=F4QTK7_9CAUL|nr:right-handed parallel beta-helix repeat-containing protein [Asticcacaulis biprosthecium]EGF90077.1 carbohydrate-binding and sugar hydrolysis [Asticcacaulis biprosthecium C19]